ncbi:MAG: tetratricopeptide repeat protein [Bacteroidales bacterium]|nr:tetratricopeptide repeat protein [Bacteroidales bacterium]
MRYIIKNILLLFASVMMSGLSAYAQADKGDVRRGNRDFRKENYREAEIDYRKALVKDSLSVAANYNLANVLYREGDMEQAVKSLERIKDTAPESASASDYFYNLGNVSIARQDWQGAVEAFAQSLLLNPGDLDAKENYIYARKMLQNQQNQQNQDGRDNQDNQDNQDQDGQDQQDRKDQDGQDQQDRQNKDNQDNQDEQQQEQQQQSGQQPKITPQAAQQMLQAIQAKEKETQDKVKKQKAEALKSRQKDKNW